MEKHLHKNPKGFLSYLYNRTVIVGLAILVQAAVLVVVLAIFAEFFPFFYALNILISMAAVLWLVNNKSNPGYKIIWIIVIMAMPVFGGVFYLMFSGKHLSRHEKRKLLAISRKIEQYNTAVCQEPVRQLLHQENPAAARQSDYIARAANCPVYQNTFTEYFPIGEAKFARMLEELEKAEHFIFMEYFIIEEGKMWNTIFEVLKRKAAQGLDVRLLYDDVGSLMTLPYRYYRTVEEAGIQCCAFNPFVPLLNARMNNRDHRKICVIDGWVGFTGGINLVDEYINVYPKHGHWKDTGILLKGDAVWSLTVMFLSMWDYVRGVEEDFSQFSPARYQPALILPQGYVQPYNDSPQDDELVGENVYLGMIYSATRYVYICTPYLIVDNEMVTALMTAAKSGVDVRIITPHIADKWFVHAVTRAYYPVLLEAGVKIYEYTPGFIHAKSFVVDDETATVGTINLDYRSLYLHFECGVWLHEAPCIQDMKQDYLDTLEKCEQITMQNYDQSPLRRLGRSILRLLAPLM